MQYVECPEIWKRLPNQPGLFLAGGITGCPDWQFEMAHLLVGTNFAVLNPRRKNFSIDDPDASLAQIKWEFEHLRKADVISFWFCKETIQPIALFELGAWSSQNEKFVAIGIEPGYPREADVRIQMGLLGRLFIMSTLEELAEEITILEKAVKNVRFKD